MSTSIWRLGSKSTHHIRRDSKGELCMHWWCSHATDFTCLAQWIEREVTDQNVHGLGNLAVSQSSCFPLMALQLGNESVLQLIDRSIILVCYITETLLRTPQSKHAQNTYKLLYIDQGSSETFLTHDKIIYLYASHTRKSILLDARLRTRRLAISASISQGRKNVPHALKVLPLFVSHQNRQQTHKTR
ncbi:hypothetical protein T265_04989 [Opisthorchis viverrini]|uniref:Uncharacterized protein n=1 Tax=Opisthorchis viverrini TaxID=6198 RepID=A0A074ZXJ7_OPIVI|nr:hypothetical protein T265_04989 [Opisthorchis viverrini]KER28075.1 hypothetical protein T265_04989 [Opisthorchis viverrini]